MATAFADAVATATRRFESSRQAPRECRRFVEGVLGAWDLDDLVEVADLLACELVTNVVRHVREPFELAVAWHDPVLRVEVSDASSVVPAALDTATETGGRGLLIVSRLASAWGVGARDGGGKSVWFTLWRRARS